MRIFIIFVLFWTQSQTGIGQKLNNQNIQEKTPSVVETEDENKKYDQSKTEEEAAFNNHINQGGKGYRFTVLKVYSEVDSISQGSLGDNIYVLINDSVSHLRMEIKNRNQNIVPFIDGIQLKSTYPHYVGDSLLMFRLTRNDQSKENWNMILRKPDLFKSKPVAFSIGFEDDQPFSTIVKNQKAFNLLII